MEFPLLFRFKLIALAPQIYVSDASGRTISYIKQKLFRLKEKIEVFSDETRTDLLGTIEADRIIDWSARYHFKNAAGVRVGSVGRKGMRSLWRAHYDVCTGSNDAVSFVISEETPIVKMLDGIVGGIPVLGMFSGFFLHPSYIAKRADGTIVMRLKKETAFWEGKFRLDMTSDLNVDEENALIFSFLMVNLLERQRG